MTIMERCGGGDEVEEDTACPVPKTWDLLKWGLMETRYHFYNGVKSEENALQLLQSSLPATYSLVCQILFLIITYCTHVLMQLRYHSTDAALDFPSTLLSGGHL